MSCALSISEQFRARQLAGSAVTKQFDVAVVVNGKRTPFRAIEAANESDAVFAALRCAGLSVQHFPRVMIEIKESEE